MRWLAAVLLLGAGGAQCPQPNQDPTARLASPVLWDARQPVPLSAEASSDPDGTLAAFTFQFGDGTPQVSWTQPRVDHVFVGAGTFTMALTVEDEHGAANTLQRPVTLVDRFTPPYCASDFDCGTNQVCHTDGGVCWEHSPP